MKRAGLIAIAVCAPAHADDEPVVASETIEITELRQPRPATYEPATVIVIDRAELERVPAPLADDVVRLIPSVGLFRRSSSAIADPTSQGLNLRGLGPSGVSRALVMRDGIPINDPFGGWVYWRALPAHAIERIEIQPSGASAMFGNFGLGGVLAIASRPIEAASIDASLAGGSRDTMRATLRATERLGPFGIELDGEAFATDGYTPIAPHDRGAVDHPASSDHHNAGARVEYGDDDAKGRVFARTFGEDLDAGTEHTTAEVRSVSYGGTTRLVRGASRLDVAAFGGEQRFEQVRARVAEDRSTAEVASRQRTPSDSIGASVLGATRLGSHTLLLGVDALRVRGTATDLLSPAMPMETSLVERSAGGEQLIAGAFVQDSKSVGRFELAAALRLDRWVQRAGRRELTRANGEREVIELADRDGLEANPRLGVLARIDDQLAVRASVYRAFRAPTLNELYRPFQVGTILTAANDQLETETLWGGEAGPQLVVGQLSARAVGFYNRLSRPIFNVTLPMPENGAGRQRQNLGAARVFGLELEAAWRPAAAWTITIAHLAIDAQVTDAPDAPDLIGRRLAQDPKSRTSLAVAYDDRVTTVSLDLRHVGTQFEDDLNTLPMGSYVLVDALVRRHVYRGIAAFATIQNALDRSYLVGRAGIDTIGQPRTVLAGIAFSGAR
jgi:iron complex outermembrane receptor protein